MIIHADCVEAMQAMEPDSVDAIVCDPPYGLEFMGKEWDALGNGFRRRENLADVERDDPFGRTSRTSPEYQAGRAAQQWHHLWATEALRVLKPGGHLLAFGGTRTYHRLACAVEDAGFEIRDSLIWIYGSGFPKSLDVSKAIDKRPGVSRHAEFAAHLRERMAAKGYTNTFDVAEAVIGRRTGAVANWQKYQWPEAKWWPKLSDLLDLDPKWGAVIAEAERERVGRSDNAISQGTGEQSYGFASEFDLTAPATPEAQHWQGWGTALKPSHEPIVVARKPLVGTVAANVLEHGTGALNIDGCRIGLDDAAEARLSEVHSGNIYGSSGIYGSAEQHHPNTTYKASGRWPPNLTLSHLPECKQTGTRKVKSQGGATTGEFESRSGFGGGKITRDYGTETIPAYSCAPGCPVAELDRQSGEAGASRQASGPTVNHLGDQGIYGTADGERGEAPFYGDTGGASRFMYVAKASRAERQAGVGANAHPT